MDLYDLFDPLEFSVVWFRLSVAFSEINNKTIRSGQRKLRWPEVEYYYGYETENRIIRDQLVLASEYFNYRKFETNILKVNICL